MALPEKLICSRLRGFRINFTGLSGRVFWELDTPEAVQYRFIVNNESVLSDDMVAPEDRVVFFKTPNSLREAQWMQKIIRITGASITAVPMILCYIMHFITLRRRGVNATKLDDEIVEDVVL